MNESAAPNTKDEPSAFDIMAEEKAAPDEPKFTLWGRDPSASKLVRDWARLNRERVFEIEHMPPDKLRVELIQCTDAEEIAWAMDAFRRGQATEPAKERAGFLASASLGADELAARARHHALLGGARSLSNALSESLDVARSIRELGFFDEAIQVEVACESLRQAAAAIRPSRPGYAHKGGRP